MSPSANSKRRSHPSWQPSSTGSRSPSTTTRRRPTRSSGSPRASLSDGLPVFSRAFKRRCLFNRCPPSGSSSRCGAWGRPGSGEWPARRRGADALPLSRAVMARAAFGVAKRRIFAGADPTAGSRTRVAERGWLGLASLGVWRRPGSSRAGDGDGRWPTLYNLSNRLWSGPRSAQCSDLGSLSSRSGVRADV